MTNSIFRPIRSKLKTKNGRYYGSFTYQSQDGEKKEVWRTLNLEEKPGNKRKAIEMLHETEYQLHGIIDVPGYELLFVDYLQEWIEKKSGEVEDSTFKGMELMVRKISQYFKNKRLRLSEIKPHHIKSYYEYLYKNGRSDGNGGLSISSIKSFKGVLNEVFKKAVINRLIVINPVESVKLPAKDNPRKQHNVLNQEKANLLLGYVVDDELMYPLLLTTLRYGLRHSEVLGLKWSAVDFSNNSIRIESVITQGRNPEKNKTKTETSKHSFPLLPDIRDALIIRKKAQDKNREMLGSNYIETDYVFTHEDGNKTSISCPACSVLYVLTKPAKSPTEEVSVPNSSKRMVFPVLPAVVK